MPPTPVYIYIYIYMYIIFDIVRYLSILFNIFGGLEAPQYPKNDGARHSSIFPKFQHRDFYRDPKSYDFCIFIDSCFQTRTLCLCSTRTMCLFSTRTMCFVFNKNNVCLFNNNHVLFVSNKNKVFVFNKKFTKFFITQLW